MLFGRIYSPSHTDHTKLGGAVFLPSYGLWVTMFIIDKNLTCLLYLYSNSRLTGIVINLFGIPVAEYLLWSNRWEERFILPHNSMWSSPLWYRNHGNWNELDCRSFLYSPESQEAQMRLKAHPSYKFQRKFPRNPTSSVAQRSYQKLGPSVQTHQLIRTFHIKTKWNIYIVSHPQMVHGVDNLEELEFVEN